MSEHFGSIRYIFSTIKSSFLPAFFLLIALVCFYAQNPFSFHTSLILHCGFLAFTALTFTLLYISNQSRLFFTLLTGCTCYFIINALKAKYGETFIESMEYRSLCFAVPLTILCLYFLPTAKIQVPRTKYVLIALLSEIVLIQHFGFYINTLPHIGITLESAPLWSYAVWAVVLFILAIASSINNSAVNTGLFYTAASIFMGVIYATSVSGLTIFFLTFTVIIACVSVIDLYHRYHYDYLENVCSKTAYLNHANTKFPFKYTIVMFAIDNGEKLQKAIGNRKYTVLEQLVVNKILDMPYDLSFYRYDKNELIMVFKNEDAKHTKEFADNIRHAIAASEFILTDGKNIKITISVCVSEKTRKDLNASEVTERTHIALNKSHRFNCNVTTVI